MRPKAGMTSYLKEHKLGLLLWIALWGLAVLLWCS
jgi:hypothetical protein